MKDETRKLLAKAARSIHAARVLLENEESEFALGRAYYAMFYIAEALLCEDGLRSRSHSGIHSLFGERFARTGRLDPKYHRWMLDAFDGRLQGDYGFEAVLTTEEVERTAAQAEEFLAVAQASLSDAA